MDGRPVDRPLSRSRGALAVVATAALIPVAPAGVGGPDSAPAAAASPRVLRSLNDGWRYAPGPLEGAEAPGFDDTGWERVDLPHTWNATDPLDDEPGYRRGAGWYRRPLRVPEELEAKRLFLRFEGANQVAEVWVDGRRVGRHAGGYTAFAFDVTGLVSSGETSLLAVRVDNSHDPEVPPLDGDWTFYGGLYRDVWLLATAPVHLDVLDHASPGVFVDTPEASREAATVRVRGAVVDDGGDGGRVEVVSRVLDREGEEVLALRRVVEPPPGGRATFEAAGTLRAPRLWSPGDPYVYRVRTDVTRGGAVVDRVEVPLGVRWFRVDAAAGFFLNGEPFRLRGTNRHQDRAGLGNALPDAAHREDLVLVKETGFDFLRLAHYPQDPAVLEAADRLGLLVWEEIPVVNRITPSEAFAESSERMLTEMIRQHYNHPSVVMWGYMNEVLLRPPEPKPAGYEARALALARRLEARAKREDRGRLTVTARSFDELGDGTGLGEVTDILGMNLYFGWYYRDFEALGPWLDSLHAARPDRPLLVSEYGAGSDERVHTTEPRAFDFSSEYQRRFHRRTFPVLEARPYLAGTAVWNQFDFGSAHRQDTKPGINQKGLGFFDRSPKDVAAWYRARLRREPVLRIAREWSRRAGSRPEDRSQPVWVHSNLAEVELFREGTSLGTRRVDNGTATWVVAFRPGGQRLTARGAAASGRGAPALEDAATFVYEDRTPLFRAEGDGSRAGDEAAGGAPAPAVPELGVNAGAHYQYVDGDGFVWEADRPYAPGSWGFVGGEAARSHHRIADTPDEPLFQASREGVREYRFDVPDGAYEVELGFAETRHREAGRRAFTVRLDDRPVIEGMDPARAPGPRAALRRSFRVEASGGEGLVLRFLPQTGEATVAAIRIRRL